MSEDDRLVGTLVADRYRVGRKLGEGGMGLVYLAVHESLRKQVALKVLGSMARLAPESVARFEREAIATANLKHPNIAEATDFGQLPDGGLYLVMEYIEGTSLRALLAEQGKLPPARALAILQQIGAALSTAHARDVVHRDLKPDNVILTSAGASDGVKVIDFGIAKIRSTTFGGGGTGLTTAGSVFGTPDYMSPEQVMGQAVDARADQYALGVLAFELLTGKPPFKCDDVSQLMMMHVGAPIPSTREVTPELPAEIDAVITRMLGKLPDERFASVAEAMEALTAAMNAPPPAPSPPSVPSVPKMPTASPRVLETTMPSPVRQDIGGVTPAKRPFVLAAAIGGAVVLAAIVIVVVVVTRSSAGQSALPPELAAALADWNDGKYEPAGAAIGKAIVTSPELAEREDVGRPLAAPVADETARRALTKLLDTTALGRSHAVASALADVAVADDPKRRDVALVLLRERQDLLSKEQGARTQLRDAETCEALDAAKASATDVATSATKRDIERVTTGECKSLLRVSSLCDTCAGAPVKAASRSGAAAPTTAQPKPAPPAPPAPPPSPDNAHGKGHGKGKGK